MARIAVLGSTGMLGSALSQLLSSNSHDVFEISRSMKPVVEDNSLLQIKSLEKSEIYELFNKHEFDYAINAIGLIKQKIDADSQYHRHQAHKTNTVFPETLNSYSQEFGLPVIQIATDCVFSGLSGGYTEDSIFDCEDIYGKSKAEGEMKSKNIMHLRCSIIGHELNSNKSLMDWLLTSDLHSEIHGFTNHLWNGLTTLHFSKIVNGIIESSLFSPGVIHLIPRDQISKFDLLSTIAEVFGRSDLKVKPLEVNVGVDRTLSTIFPLRNKQLWSSAGYNEIPSIVDMLTEYRNWSP